VSEHEHDHPHEPIENGDEPPAAARARALEQILIEKGAISREDVRERIDWLVSRSPADGARLVARAWVDPDFKQRLLADARSAALELGLDPGPSPVVVAVENTEDVHHMVVCTLCSCYPRALLALRRPGTRAFPTARVQSPTRAACWTSSASSWARTSSCGCSTRPPISAIW
jgi:nitrile hydratase